MDTNKKRPSNVSSNITEKMLGQWLSAQLKYYKKKTGGMKDESRYNLWTQFLKNYKLYFNNLNTQFIETTSTSSNKQIILTTDETENNTVEEEIQPKEIEIIEEETDIPEEDFLSSLKKKKKKKSMKLTKTNKQKVESNEQKQTRVKSEMSQLHQRYKTLKSENLKKEFNENPELWHKYHSISEENEKSFLDKDIPRNRVIQQLDELNETYNKELEEYRVLKEYFDKADADLARAAEEESIIAAVERRAAFGKQVLYDAAKYIQKIARGRIGRAIVNKLKGGGKKGKGKKK
jgi:hypothetical protein